MHNWVLPVYWYFRRAISCAFIVHCWINILIYFLIRYSESVCSPLNYFYILLQANFDWVRNAVVVFLLYFHTLSGNCVSEILKFNWCWRSVYRIRSTYTVQHKFFVFLFFLSSASSWPARSRWSLHLFSTMNFSIFNFTHKWFFDYFRW